MSDKIFLNDGFKTRLGWRPEMFGGATIDDKLIEAITREQARLGVTADGLFGPQSYKAWIERELDVILNAKGWGLQTAGLVALYTAKWFWLQNIRDSAAHKPSLALIDGMIRSDDGLGWSWLPTYEQDSFEWCLAFVARCWKAAGLAFYWRKFFLASTIRVDCWARYANFEDRKNIARPTTGARMIIKLDENSVADDAVFPDGSRPRAGDILLVGGAKTGPGKHGALVESFDPITGEFTTIEGNATGALPNGNRAHGVIRTRRPIGGVPRRPIGGVPNSTAYHARRVIRPALGDLE